MLAMPRTCWPTTSTSSNAKACSSAAVPRPIGRRAYLQLVPDALEDLHAGTRSSRAAGGVRLHRQLRPLPARRRLWRRSSTVPAASAGTHPATQSTRAQSRSPRDTTLASPSRSATLDSTTSSRPTTSSSPSATTPTKNWSAGSVATGLHWSVPDPVRAGTEVAFEPSLRRAHPTRHRSRPPPPRLLKEHHHDRDPTATRTSPSTRPSRSNTPPPASPTSSREPSAPRPSSASCTPPTTSSPNAPPS